VWEAVVTADRDQFERNATTGVEFPSGYAERRFALTGAEVRIGRSRGRPGEQVPEINLAGAPEDPAVSHIHALLERQPDGSYALRDLGSTNGTTVNDDATPISADAAAPLAEGDRIRIGAWTTLTLRRA
jgi:pSer/pThr/pTyr-binding forkhead associated (FHA) protein